MKHGFKVGCCVPGCHRTAERPNAGEWICGQHWRRVSPETRAVFLRAARRWKTDAAIDRLWTRCKRQAGDAFGDFFP